MIAACLKWVDRRPEIDRLTGDVHTDARTSGPSDADEAALEWALRMAEQWRDEVVAIAAGGVEVEPMLRDAMAAGAARVVRIDIDQRSSSDVVAAAIASWIRTSVVDTVVCGVWSLDRGSGSVPAFVAAHLDAAQVLGAVNLTIDAARGALDIERRLDRGRRERVRVMSPAVVSVEGASARVRRAALDRVVAARSIVIEVHRPGSRPTGSPGSRPAAPAAHAVPFRPRARVLAAPPRELSARERILALSGALVDREPPRVVRLDPAAAADELLSQLHTWGYL